MARGLLAAAAVLLLFAVTVRGSRFHIEHGEEGRFLLQTGGRQPDCTKINPSCKTCRNQRIPGTRRSELVCSTCDTGYRLRRDGTNKKCDCAPGLAMVDGVCTTCPAGKFCMGGDGKVNPNSLADACPDGLETVFAGAKSQAQCFTRAGYGRASVRGADGKVTLNAVECPVGTYNVGKNTAGCQKCGAGLTTASTQSAAATDCMAPAGSYMDKGIGKVCQKGTYSIELNTDTNCQVCPNGITTAGEGSDKAADCSLAMKGYYLVDATTAAPCPVDTYQDQEAAAQACTPCLNGWRTKEEGATGAALCLAPPGWELKEGAQNITQCEDGFFKPDWNRNLCEKCGENVWTEMTGAVSKDACKVLPGWGLTSLNPMVAAKCAKNTYGHDTSRVAASNVRCTPCPADMFTLDTLEARSINVGETYTSEAACLVQPGWGITPTTPQKCPVGTYNAGKNREPCKECGTGWTTVADGKTSANECVIQPGWEMNLADGIPEPCDKGKYSTGGTEVAPNATCLACSTGYTTQDDESAAESDCGYCAAGYGGASCAMCPANTFSTGGAAAGDACMACADGSVSKPGATQSQQCYSQFIDARNDVYNLADDGKWEGVAADTAATCAATCNTADCVMYRFVGVSGGTGACSLFKAAATGTKVGFKIGNADDYVVYTVDTAVGAEVATSAADTEQDCLTACSSNPECELYRFDAAAAGGSRCSLAKSELEEDSICMFQVQGLLLASYQP